MEFQVFTNGKQINIQQDGRVCDNHDPVPQMYYDCANRTRRHLRRRQLTLQTTDDDVQPTSEQNSSRVDRNGACLSDTLNNEPDDTLRGRGLTSDEIQPPLVVDIVDNGVSVGADLPDIANRLYKQILSGMQPGSVTVDQEGTDTASAHSEGHSLYPRQLLHEALHRFSYKYHTVSELNTHLRDETTELADGGKQAKDESSKIPRFSSAGFAGNGLTASASSTTFTGSASSVVNYHHGESVDARELRPDMPAYIHDSKSLENENARLHAELAASRSKLRRQGELQVQSDQQQCDELDRLRQTQMECKNKSVKLMKDSGDLQVAVSQLNRDKSNLEAEISMVRIENEENIAGRKKTEESRKAVLTEVSEPVEISEQVTDLRDAAFTDEACCKTLIDKREHLVRKTQDMESENKGLEIRARDLSNTVRLLEVDNSELKHVVGRLQFENAEMKTKIAALTKKNADFRTKMEQWDRANASADGIMRNLVREKGEIRNVVRQLASLGTDVESLFENMDNFCVQLQETQLVDADTSTDVSEVSSLVLADVQAGDNADLTTARSSSTPH